MEEKIVKKEGTANFVGNGEEKVLILECIDLAKKKYLINENRYLVNEFSFFLFNVKENIPNHRNYSVSYEAAIETFFKEEYLCAEEVSLRIESKLGRLLNKQEKIYLAEVFISSNYNLSKHKNEQEEFINLVNTVMEKLKFKQEVLSLSQNKSYVRFLHHIKYLVLRILNKEVDTSKSDDEIYFYMKRKYPNSFTIANQVRVYITEKYDFVLSNNETSSLTLHFEKLTKEGLL